MKPDNDRVEPGEVGPRIGVNYPLLVVSLALMAVSIAELSARRVYDPDTAFKPQVHEHTVQRMTENNSAWTIIEWSVGDQEYCQARRWNDKDLTLGRDATYGQWTVTLWDELSIPHYFATADEALKFVRQWCK